MPQLSSVPFPLWISCKFLKKGTDEIMIEGIKKE